MRDSGFQDVDYVLTTRELATMIQQTGINVSTLKAEKYDSLMGVSTGAAVIFGATGGVMEAAIRTAYELVTGREVPFEGLNIKPLRGFEGIREASVVIENVLPDWSFLEGVELKVAIAHGLANARKLMNAVEKKEVDLHFIEIMACPGGCLGGGGHLFLLIMMSGRPDQKQSIKKMRKCLSENPMKIPKLWLCTRIF